VWLLLNVLLPWDLFFAYQLQRYKAALRGQLPAWLEAWYELEALNSLANFAYLNPHYNFPQISRDASPVDGAIFSAQAMGHPLIPEADKVRNDFRMDSLGRVALITGSNMSGKTTFLRTLGANLCLAYAGSPVDAAGLRTIPWRLFTCIEVSDSLSDGISYFYAEVRRLKDLLDALRSPHPRPLFFLIDEIFRGTNNRERQIGGRAYVRALAGGHGSGLISTHDLELVTLADALSQVTNYHFQETILDGRMVFDYRLRLGPSPTTNALRIMEMEGLPV
jgi:DNA mismatch repair ATPase MutS